MGDVVRTRVPGKHLDGSVGSRHQAAVATFSFNTLNSDPSPSPQCRPGAAGGQTAAASSSQQQAGGEGDPRYRRVAVTAAAAAAAASGWVG
jgi:hypothetical protein